MAVHASKLNVLAFVMILTSVNGGSSGQMNLTFSQHYDHGVESYLDERWQDCITHFEAAAKGYRKEKEESVNCRIKCQIEADEEEVMFPENVENLHFYERVVKKTLCMLKCRDVQLFQEKKLMISKEMERNFEQMKLYEYLQLCYYQKNFEQKAASATFTFLVANPKHENMLSNLRFYTSLPDVNSDEIVNYEAQPYIASYVHGLDAYKHEDYNLVINYFEESLELYLAAEEGCRAHCEGPFDQGWFPDYTSSIANHFTYCLKCKRKCPSQLNSVNGELHEDFLASHYHYMQYAYFKVGNIAQACEAATSYLLFYPADETMLDNIKYYKKMPKAKPEFFQPREDALKYMKRQEYENKLLSFIEKEFILQENEHDNDIDDNNVNEAMRDDSDNGLNHYADRINGNLSKMMTHLNLSKNKQTRKLIRHEKLGGIIRNGINSQGNVDSTRHVDLNKIMEAAKSMKERRELNGNVEPGINKQIILDGNNKEEKRIGEKLEHAKAPLEKIGERLSEIKENPKLENMAEKFWKTLRDMSECPATSRSRSLRGDGEEKRTMRKIAMLKLIEKSVIQQHTDLVKGNEKLNEPNRFLAEGFAHDTECEAMLQLARVAAVKGDGYGGKPSPLSEYETFDGMSIGRAALMVYFGLMEPEMVEVFINISERGRVFVERYFRLKSKLYFNYAHLVCRTALNVGDSKSNKSHLSHPIHGDNCDLLENGNCPKRRPAFIWRDYSAVIYLNDDFEGGEFFFAANPKQNKKEKLIKSRCGRMVAFTSGGENLHGVKGIARGKRCAIGLWFTLDPKYNEPERILAKYVIHQVKQKGSVSDELLKDLKHMTGV